VAASHEIPALGPSDNVNFVLAGNPERPNGGILARFPAGTYIPILGITGGTATSATGARVVMVTQLYDGIADAPAYSLNLVADLNTLGPLTPTSNTSTPRNQQSSATHIARTSYRSVPARANADRRSRGWSQQFRRPSSCAV